MNRSNIVVAGAVCASMLGAAAIISHAGPLNPPTGAVSSTYKTLTEVEPRIAINATNTPGDASSLFKITQPGSYYLTGNIAGVAGKHGIAIAADGVTLDLNDFALAGVAGSFDGVTTFGVSHVRLEIKNGSIGGFGDRGVDFNGAGTVVSDLRVRSCVSDGIRVGEAAVVTRCTSGGNQSSGIVCGASGVIDNCTVRSNNLNGIDAADGSTIRGCAAGANGEYGISTAQGSSISNCSAYENGNHGILTSSACAITDCSALRNLGRGISAALSATVTNCVATSNTDNGISTASGGTVTNCSAYENGVRGVEVEAGSTVTGCSVTANALDGIKCSFACVIRGNSCSYNGFETGDGAGIRATSNDNRIEGNNCTNADRGIDVDGSGNIIIRNTCAGNAVNWTILAGNAYGPIVATPAGAAVNGNTAVAALGSTDPNANFTY